MKKFNREGRKERKDLKAFLSGLSVLRGSKRDCSQHDATIAPFCSCFSAVQFDLFLQHVQDLVQNGFVLRRNYQQLE